MKFGDYLRQKRQGKGWTQPDAAARCEIEQSYLSKLETGKAFPSDDVFRRLAAVYDIDPGDMVGLVYPSELDRLREVTAVRDVVLRHTQQNRVAAQRWLVIGLALVMGGGGFLGLTRLDSDREVQQFVYQSWGVTRPEEPPRLLIDAMSEQYPSDAEFDADRRTQAQVLTRLAPIKRSVTEFYGPSYTEEVEGGRRYWALVGSDRQMHLSRFRWAYVPALALLFGGVACGFVSWRWTRFAPAVSDPDPAPTTGRERLR